MAELVAHAGPPIPHMARRHYPRVCVQLLWRLRVDLLVMLGLCVAASLSSALLRRDLITQPEVEATLGIAVSVFLAFRNTQAINRWWEARGLWGAVVNQSRTWRDTLLVLLGTGREQRRGHQRLLQLQVLAVWLLNLELRNWAEASHRRTVLALATRLGFTPAVTLQQLSRARALLVNQLAAQGQLSDLGRDALIRSMAAFNDAVGGLQKIRNTPLPPAYDAFVRLIAWLFGFELYLDCLAAGTPVVGGLLFLGFLLAERLAAYVEGPFDRDPSSLSLPLNQICLGISNELLGGDALFADLPSCSDPSIWT
ncbi:MAG: bestrophin family ion channel [Cyanobacteriota bacterium]|nr:bestrophin family ion channel [Cyanobacteriota bacterium]